MSDRIEKNVKLMRNNPQLSGNQIYLLAKSLGYGIKKQTFYQIHRRYKVLPEAQIPKPKPIPTPILVSKPVKKRVVVKKIPRPIKPISLPKKRVMNPQFKSHVDKAISYGMTKKEAIYHVRKLLKIPKRDIHKLNTRDYNILAPS